MWTCNWMDLETLGSQPIKCPKIFPHNAWELLPYIWQHLRVDFSPGFRVIVEVELKSEYVDGAYALNPN